MSKPISDEEICKIRNMDIPECAKALWLQNRSFFTVDIIQKPQPKKQPSKQGRRMIPIQPFQKNKFVFNNSQPMPIQMPIQMPIPIQMPMPMPMLMMQPRENPNYVSSDGLYLSIMANGQWLILTQNNKFIKLTPNIGHIFTTPEGFITLQKATGECVYLYRN
jgi:hypothetical protein